MKKALAILTVAAMGIFASQVSAATLTFGSYATTTDNTGAFPTPLVTVNDDTAGLISFSISSSGASGNLSGAFFDISGVMLSVGDILNEFVSLAGFGTFTGNIGGGVVMNGTYSDPSATNNPTFDFGLRIAQTNVSATPFTFQISSTLLALTDIERIGLRFQTVSGANVTQSSAKVIGTPEGPSVVPIPAAGLMLLTALGGLAFARRRKA